MAVKRPASPQRQQEPKRERGGPGPQSRSRWPLLLIEHGRTHFDRQKRVHGRCDPPLDHHGVRQAIDLGIRLAGMEHPPERLYTSDRRRAVQTARIAGAVAGIPTIVAPALRPLDVGTWSGDNEKEVARRLKPYFARPWKRIPEGDRVAQWRARHLRFVRDLVQQASKRGLLPALVTHSNVIGSLATHVNHARSAREALAHPPRSGTIQQITFPVINR